MAIFERPLKWFKSNKRSIQVGTESTYQPSAMLDFGTQVTPSGALRMTAYYAGVRLIAENVASLPKKVLIETASGMAPDTKNPVYKAINRKPNGYTNVFDFWFTIIAWILNRGNAYVLIEKDQLTGELKLHQIHPDYVQVVLIKGRKYYKVNHPDSDLSFLNGTWADWQMLHFMQFTMDGVFGLNPVIYNAIALNKGMAIERFIANYFRKGGDKRAVLETDGNLGDEAYKNFIKHYSSTGSGGTPLLEYGIKYKQINVDPVTAALIESEIFSIDDIARMLNIPPHMLAEMSHSTFSNIEHQTIQFVEYTLRPIVKRLEVELETKLFNYRETREVKFVLDGLLRGDTAARTAFYHGAVLDGYMTRNEVRKLEGLPAAEGLDDFMYPANESVLTDEEQTAAEKIPTQSLSDLSVNERRELVGYEELPDAQSDEKILAEIIGVGGTQAMMSVMQDETLTISQKKELLKLLFGLTDEDVNKLFKGVKDKGPSDDPDPETKSSPERDARGRFVKRQETE